MRILTLCIVFLVIIQQAFAKSDTCKCSCCNGNGCTAVLAGTEYHVDCSLTCTRDYCLDQYSSSCLANAFSKVEPACDPTGGGVNPNGTEQLLSSLFIIFGVISIIFMMKD